MNAFVNSLKEFVSIFRQVLTLFYQMALCLKPPFRAKEILSHTVAMGVDSLPIIIIATAFAGIVVTEEIAWHMDHALNTVEMIPGFTAQFILRELGIAIPALLLVAKVGASTTAEVGTMKITEQIDALKLLQIDVVKYLVYPRFMASVLSTVCLTLIAVFVTLFCSVMVATTQFHFQMGEYLQMMARFVGFKDLACAVVKGAVFGAVIPLIAVSFGFQCKGGAEGVGTATTNSVVSATLSVIVLDFILTYAFTAFF